MRNDQRTDSAERFRAGKRLWNPEDDALLRVAYPDAPTHEVAACLGRTVQAVYVRAQAMAVRKSTAYLASPAACRLRRIGDDHPGRATQFKPGQVPHNKGLRRPGWHRGRMKTTWFKRGQRSGKAAAHHMPVGRTRLIEGYVYRKVSDIPNVPYTVNWKPEHHLVWAAAHGPVPKGHALIFRNGDRTDVRLDNLQLLTRRELMARNSVQNLPPALRQAVQLLGALNRKIRRRTHGEEQDRRSA